VETRRLSAICQGDERATKRLRVRRRGRRDHPDVEAPLALQVSGGLGYRFTYLLARHRYLFSTISRLRALQLSTRRSASLSQRRTWKRCIWSKRGV
jgi:hypothetical protein